MYVRFGKKSLSPVASAAAVLIENAEKQQKIRPEFKAMC